MSDDPPKANQHLNAGSGSNNYQAGKDMHIHHAPQPTESSIIRPTNAQVRKFDPNVRRILEVADFEDMMHYRLSESRPRLAKGQSLLPRLAIAVVLIFVIYKFWHHFF